MKGEIAGTEEHAVKLYDLDAEMRALTDSSIHLPTKHNPLSLLSSKAEGGLESVHGISPEATASGSLLTLEELERSLEAPHEGEDQAPRSSYDGSNADSSHMARSGRNKLDSKVLTTSAVDEATQASAVLASAEEPSGWIQCTEWKACPIGHLANQRLEVCTGMEAIES